MYFQLRLKTQYLLNLVFLFACSAHRLTLRSVEKVYKATAPATVNSGNSIYGPRRVIGSQDIEGKGTKHDFEICDPFLYFDDSLLPRGQSLPGILQMRSLNLP